MSDQFNDRIKATIKRCRRIASITHDRNAAAKLLELAAQLQATLPAEPSVDERGEGDDRAAND